MAEIKRNKKQKISLSEIEKVTNSLNIEVVKLIGILNGTQEKIEIIMDKNTFFEWVEILKTRELKK